MTVNFKHALIVEDSFIEASKLEELCRRLSIEVLSITSNESDAVDKAVRLKPDLVFMDINLGDGGDGIKAANKISENLSTPVIYTSAYDDSETIESAMSVKPYGYVIKPFNLQQLKTTIRVAEERYFKEIQEKSAFDELKRNTELFNLSSLDLGEVSDTLCFKGTIEELQKVGKVDLGQLTKELPKSISEELLTTLKKGNVYKLTAKLLPKGTKAYGEKWISLVLSMSPDNDSEVRIGAIKDVTEIYNLKHKVLVSDAILDEIKDGIVIVDQNNLITQTNTAFCRFLINVEKRSSIKN